jgi:hypothetical protein
MPYYTSQVMLDGDRSIPNQQLHVCENWLKLLPHLGFDCGQCPVKQLSLVAWHLR